MKKISYLLFIYFLVFASCNKNSDLNVNFRSEMRTFVKEISQYAKGKQSLFCIIPQNGQELFTDTGDKYGVPQTDYLAAIDATGREDFLYGYDADDKATTTNDTERMKSLLEIGRTNGVKILAIDYCSTSSKMYDSYSRNSDWNYLSFAADRRELNNIPAFPSTPFRVNDSNITHISNAKNFLYLINPSSFASKKEFLTALIATDFDILIIDLFYNEEILTPSEVMSLKTKSNGGTRLVFSYMSIGEAENYRYYWQTAWNSNKPSWLEKENPLWKGNYKVRYWNSEWKQIIYGNANAYLDKIMFAQFDGVYLDIIDAYEYFE
jgi:cysteinyl-tRNA synthetase